MLKLALCTVVTGIGLGSLGTPRPLAAQDCGKFCLECAAGFYEGQTFDATGEWNMDCLATETGTCDECAQAELAVGVVDGRLIARVVQLASVSELSAVIAAFRERLLVVPTRGLVVIVGTACNEHAVAALVYVQSEKVRALRRLGVGTYDYEVAWRTGR